MKRPKGWKPPAEPVEEGVEEPAFVPVKPAMEAPIVGFSYELEEAVQMGD